MCLSTHCHSSSDQGKSGSHYPLWSCIPCIWKSNPMGQEEQKLILDIRYQYSMHAGHQDPHTFPKRELTLPWGKQQSFLEINLRHQELTYPYFLRQNRHWTTSQKDDSSLKSIIELPLLFSYLCKISAPPAINRFRWRLQNETSYNKQTTVQQ